MCESTASGFRQLVQKKFSQKLDAPDLFSLLIPRISLTVKLIRMYRVTHLSDHFLKGYTRKAVATTNSTQIPWIFSIVKLNTLSKTFTKYSFGNLDFFLPKNVIFEYLFFKLSKNYKQTTRILKKTKNALAPPNNSQILWKSRIIKLMICFKKIIL